MKTAVCRGIKLTTSLIYLCDSRIMHQAYVCEIMMSDMINYSRVKEPALNIKKKPYLGGII